MNDSSVCPRGMDDIHGKSPAIMLLGVTMTNMQKCRVCVVQRRIACTKPTEGTEKLRSSRPSRGMCVTESSGRVPGSPSSIRPCCAAAPKGQACCGVEIPSNRRPHTPQYSTRSSRTRSRAHDVQYYTPSPSTYTPRCSV